MDEDLITPVNTSANDVQAQQLPLQAFYDTELLEVPEAAKRLLVEYSGIPEDEVLPHILSVRDRAWKTYPFPCIGHYRFLDFALPRSKAYKDILTRLKTPNQQFLDMGCCLGQELRHLVHDGAHAQNLYGIDLRADFFDIGYDLFRDRERLASLFLAADLFERGEGGVLEQLKGRFDIVWCSAVLHLFSWKGQVNALASILRLLKKGPGTMIAGRLMGSVKPGEHGKDGVPSGSGSDDKTTYRHDAKSFKKMFHEACEAVGEKWETDVDAKQWQESLQIKKSDETVQDGLLEVWFVARKLERVDIATSHHVVKTWGAGDDAEFL